MVTNEIQAVSQYRRRAARLRTMAANAETRQLWKSCSVLLCIMSNR